MWEFDSPGLRLAVSRLTHAYHLSAPTLQKHHQAYLNELDITASVVQAPLTASGVIATPDFTTRNVDAALDNMHAPVFARPADDEAAAGSAAPGRSATVGGPGGSAPAAAAADGRASGFADTAPAKVGLDEEHMWKQRATLRSHFDAVQTVAWYEDAPLLLTASEDCTVKVTSVCARVVVVVCLCAFVGICGCLFV